MALELSTAAWALWFAIGLIILFGVLVSWYLFPMPKAAAAVFGTIGVIACLIGLVLASGIIGTTTIVEEDDELVAWEVAGSVDAGDTHLTLYPLQKKIQMAVLFNDTAETFLSDTEYLEANFTILRADALDKNAVAVVKLNTASVPLIVISGAPNEYLIDEVSTGQFAFAMTKGGAATIFYESMNVIVEAVGDAEVSVNITLNAAAVLNMDLYETQSFTISIAGEIWTIEVVKASIAG